MSDTEKLKAITQILVEYDLSLDPAPSYYLRKIRSVVIDDEEDDGK